MDTKGSLLDGDITVSGYNDDGRSFEPRIEVNGARIDVKEGHYDTGLS